MASGYHGALRAIEIRAQPPVTRRVTQPEEPRAMTANAQCGTSALAIGTGYRAAMNLLLVRHGETTWNREGRYQGRTDVPLSEAGLAQAHALGARLAGLPIAIAIASPLERTRRTAEAILGDRPVSLEADQALIEISHGQWEGQLASAIEISHAEMFGTSVHAARSRTHRPGDARSRDHPAPRELITVDCVIKVVANYYGLKPPRHRAIAALANPGVTCSASRFDTRPPASTASALGSAERADAP
jgi:hypothetical protein